MGAILEVEVLP